MATLSHPRFKRTFSAAYLQSTKCQNVKSQISNPPHSLADEMHRPRTKTSTVPVQLSAAKFVLLAIAVFFTPVGHMNLVVVFQKLVDFFGRWYDC